MKRYGMSYSACLSSMRVYDILLKKIRMVPITLQIKDR